MEDKASKAAELADPVQAEKFGAEGGCVEQCPSVCGQAAKWVVKILEEKGLV